VVRNALGLIVAGETIYQWPRTKVVDTDESGIFCLPAYQGAAMRLFTLGEDAAKEIVITRLVDAFPNGEGSCAGSCLELDFDLLPGMAEDFNGIFFSGSNYDRTVMPANRGSWRATGEGYIPSCCDTSNNPFSYTTTDAFAGKDVALDQMGTVTILLSQHPGEKEYWYFSDNNVFTFSISSSRGVYLGVLDNLFDFTNALEPEVVEVEGFIGARIRIEGNDLVCDTTSNGIVWVEGGRYDLDLGVLGAMRRAVWNPSVGYCSVNAGVPPNSNTWLDLVSWEGFVENSGELK
jgi:hypothetical protein